MVHNADGTQTFFKNGESLTYDADGFPLFRSQGDVYLPVEHLSSVNANAHKVSANKAMEAALLADPDLAKRLGLPEDAVTYFLNNRSSKVAPEGYVWHHHQDIGRMQLVLVSEHKLLPSGHVGGMKIWGGSYK